MSVKNYQKSDTSILLTSTQLQEHVQLGRDRSRQLAEKADAIVHFGNSVRFNRKKIDAYLESISEGREKDHES